MRVLLRTEGENFFSSFGINNFYRWPFYLQFHFTISFFTCIISKIVIKKDIQILQGQCLNIMSTYHYLLNIKSNFNLFCNIVTLWFGFISQFQITMCYFYCISEMIQHLLHKLNILHKSKFICCVNDWYVFLMHENILIVTFMMFTNKAVRHNSTCFLC